MTIQQYRATAFAIACVAVGLLSAAPARAGLINPTSTVNIFFDYNNPNPANRPTGAQVAPSQVFQTAAPGPFSLAAPITGPMYTSEPYNLTSITGFFFTDTTVTIYNNARLWNSVLFQQFEHGLKLCRSL